jgi:hypothetical protein
MGDFCVRPVSENRSAQAARKPVRPLAGPGAGGTRGEVANRLDGHGWRQRWARRAMIRGLLRQSPRSIRSSAG